MVRERATHAHLFSNIEDRVDLALVVGVELVDTDHWADSMAGHVLHLLAKISCADGHIIWILFEHIFRQRLARDNLIFACVELQRPHRRDHHSSIWLEATIATLDVEEFLSTDISAKAGLGDQEIAALDADAICEMVKDWVPAAYGAFEDYRMGGATLSGKALDCVRKMLAGEDVTQETSGMSKGEWREFKTIIDGTS